MASLDDFFAKKDKKKIKSTKKFVTLDEVVKNLEETNKGDKNSQKNDTESQINHPEIQLRIFEEDDEWKNFKEEKKDYSGLKIGQLVSEMETLNTNGNSDGSSDDQASKNDSGETKGPGANIWKAIEQPEEPVVVEEQSKPEAEAETAAKPTKYVPPSMRVSKKLPPKKTNQKIAPKLCSEEFPSLKPKAAAVAVNNSKKSKK